VINHRYCTPSNCRGINDKDDADLHSLQLYRLLDVYNAENDKFDLARLPPKGPVMPYPYGTYSFSGNLLPQSVPAGHLRMMTASSPRCYGAILR
jgi:hypothetical protein